MLIVPRNPASQKNTSTAKKALRTKVVTLVFKFASTLSLSKFNWGVAILT